MRINKLLLALTFAVPMLASAADKPLNFDYSATGQNGDRPSLIFNDGNDTFIQLFDGQMITGDLSRVGPYYVHKGLPNEFDVSINNKLVIIKKTKITSVEGKVKIKPDDIFVKEVLVTPSVPSNDLVIKKDQSLSFVIKEYSKARGITVTWDSVQDIRIKKNIRITCEKKSESPSVMLIAFLKSLGYEAGGSESSIFVMDKIKGNV